MVFWAKSLIIMYGIRFGGGRVEILTSPIITPPLVQVNSTVIPIYRIREKEFLNLVTVLTLHIDPQNLKITM